MENNLAYYDVLSRRQKSKFVKLHIDEPISCQNDNLTKEQAVEIKVGEIKVGEMASW
jgi:hypothetical protein